jgi:hypothetical protein
MNTQAVSTTARLATHKGPHTGMLALLYTVLFCVGLFPVTAMYGKPYWPGPWEPASVIVPYFQTHGGQVMFCIFLQLGAMICLGLFTATVVSRLHFNGVRAAGSLIALFGGFLVVFDAMVGAMVMWTLLHPGVIDHPPLLLALYYLAYALGGPGFSIPMGLFMAGVSVTAAFGRLLPKWVNILGLFLAAAGELSWFHLVAPKLLFLIPLVRFPGFVWLIAVGFLLPKVGRGTPEASVV